MSVNSTKNNVNKERLIASSATALIAGAGWAVAAYNSKPWLKNGMPSDAFLKEVEKNLVGKTDKETVKSVKLLETYKSDIMKASSIENIADAQLKFYANRTSGNTFKEIKSLVKSDMYESLKHGFIGDGLVDTMLDCLNDVKRASNMNELRNVMIDYIEINNEGYSLKKIKRFYKTIIEESQEISGYKSFNETAKKAISSAYDAKTQKFVFNTENITDEMFRAVKKAAKGMQTRTAALCGILGAAVFGAAAFLMTKSGVSKK